jgi:hypothetical protein
MAGDPTHDSRPDPRQQRLAAALRDNLKRRKAQIRGRRENGVGTAEVTPPISGPSPGADPMPDPTSGAAARERT